jgi:polar amino acid transport system substrate-binding protein
MRGFLIAAFALATWSASPALAADCPVKAPSGLVNPGALTFGTMLTSPPQMFSEKGEPTGFEIDLARAIAGEMCLRVEFVNLAFAGLFPGLTAKKFDLITSGLGITPQREETFDFVPYFVGGIQLVVRKDTGLSFKDENDLCGRSVATISGTTQARALERVNKEVCTPDKQIDLKYYPSFNEAVIQLRKGTTEVAFVDWPFAAYITNLIPELTFGSPIISGRPEVPRNKLGLAFRKGEPELVNAVRLSLESVQKSGKYEELLAKWHLQGGDIRSWRS